jgi:4-aminobutyrate aminotransferase / (S)-3-amino-2-methylpropionate transaminase / 5-aminovalerate transaminase
MVGTRFALDSIGIFANFRFDDLPETTGVVMSSSKPSARLAELRANFVPQGPFNVTPYFAANAKGAMVYDVDGREFIDFAGGIGVMNVGHSHPKVVAAIKDQAEKFTHTCFHIVMYEPYLKLSEKLCALTPGSFPKMAMFATPGAGALKNSVKVADITPSGRPLSASKTAFTDEPTWL